MTPLRINIANLPLGAYAYDLESRPEEVELDTRFTSTVRVHVELEKMARGIALRAEVNAIGHFQCDRCLEDFDSNLVANFSHTYLTSESDDYNLDDDVTIISPEANFIDLGEDVRQYVLLAIPQKLLCKEDCAGLCPRCGKNLNYESCNCDAAIIDPRWAPLAQLATHDHDH